jgi:7-cyano-7-deazaguanine reductase
MPPSPLDHAPLGRDVTYPTQYDPSVLFVVNRATNRAQLPFIPNWIGADIWNAYEVSWLNARGKPAVAIARFIVPQNSPHIIESKSLTKVVSTQSIAYRDTWKKICRKSQAHRFKLH